MGMGKLMVMIPSRWVMVAVVVMVVPLLALVVELAGAAPGAARAKTLPLPGAKPAAGANTDPGVAVFPQAGLAHTA